jgi:hypothetical protein
VRALRRLERIGGGDVRSGPDAIPTGRKPPAGRSVIIIQFRWLPERVERYLATK